MTTDTKTIEETVAQALEQFGAEPDAIKREATWEELEIDSLDLAELAQIVEDEYGVRIPGEDMKQILTVGDAVDYISARA